MATVGGLELPGYGRGHARGVVVRWMEELGRKVIVARARAPTGGGRTVEGWIGEEGNRGAYEGTQKGCPYRW